jgi:hypothetical protein
MQAAHREQPGNQEEVGHPEGPCEANKPSGRSEPFRQAHRRVHHHDQDDAPTFCVVDECDPRIERRGPFI